VDNPGAGPVAERRTVGATRDGATMTAMTVRTATALISADEFLAQDHPIGSELIDGVVHVNDPGFRHQILCSRVTTHSCCGRARHPGRGRPGRGGNWVLNDRNVYQPDV